MQISQSPSFNSISGSVNSSPVNAPFDNYLFNFDQLKKDENWKEITLLGNQALSNCSILPAQKAKIHAQLASCYYYLGDYESSANHASSCLEISECLDDPILLMRSLYLLSAHKRGEGNKNAAIDPKQADQYFKEARSLIDKAFLYFDHCKDDFIKAKVLFNAGAAHSDDPNGDLKIATQRYQEAIKIYRSLEEYDDFARTSIRLGKVFLLQGKLDDLSSLLNKIDINLLPQKTKVHYQYLEAQYYVAIEDYPKARFILLDAIKDAKALEMAADLDRLSRLLKEIEINSLKS